MEHVVNKLTDKEIYLFLKPIIKQEFFPQSFRWFSKRIERHENEIFVGLDSQFFECVILSDLSCVFPPQIEIFSTKKQDEINFEFLKMMVKKFRDNHEYISKVKHWFELMKSVAKSPKREQKISAIEREVFCENEFNV